MNQKEILEKVREITIDILGVDEVLPNHKFKEDLGTDSLDDVELIIEYENEFNIAIDDDKAELIKTVQDVVILIDGLVEK